MKLSDKLYKIDTDFTINMYDNGYMIEAGGQDEEDNWVRAKINCTAEELIELVKEATEMKRND